MDNCEGVSWDGWAGALPSLSHALFLPFLQLKYQPGGRTSTLTLVKTPCRPCTSLPKSWITLVLKLRGSSGQASSSLLAPLCRRLCRGLRVCPAGALPSRPGTQGHGSAVTLLLRSCPSRGAVGACRRSRCCPQALPTLPAAPRAAPRPLAPSAVWTFALVSGRVPACSGEMGGGLVSILFRSLILHSRLFF